MFFFTPKLALDAKLKIRDLLEDTVVSEGFEVDPESLLSFNPDHERMARTSLETNPTLAKPQVTFASGEQEEIPVYSIFQRVGSPEDPADGNPVIYAFKEEKGFRFKDGEAEKAFAQARDIMQKFLKMYFSKIAKQSSVATVVVPSGNILNSRIASLLEDEAKKLGFTLKLYDKVLRKMYVTEVLENVVENGKSDFSKWIYSSGMSPAKKAKVIQEFKEDLEAMNKLHNEEFAYHYVRNPKIRNLISTSMTLDINYYKDNFLPMNEQHVLLVDDSMSRGASIKEACELICSGYHPKSIVGLTLLSKKY